MAEEEREEREERTHAKPAAAVTSRESPSDVAFAGARKILVYAAAALALGLAVAGALDRTTGGVIVLASWLGGIGALHRLGRAGSERQAVSAKR